MGNYLVGIMSYALAEAIMTNDDVISLRNILYRAGLIGVLEFIKVNQVEDLNRSAAQQIDRAIDDLERIAERIRGTN